MAANVTSIARRGWIIEAGAIPQGFGEHLERAGVARRVAKTDDGMYVEPVAPLASVIGAFERCGIRVRGVRRAGGEGSWQESARPARYSRARLGNPWSAEWLPTLPAA